MTPAETKEIFVREVRKMKCSSRDLVLMAGGLMLLAAALFALIGRWVCAALLVAGALGCFAGGIWFYAGNKND